MSDPIIVNPEPTVPPKVPPCDVFVRMKVNNEQRWDVDACYEIESPESFDARADELVFHLTATPHPAIVEAARIMLSAKNGDLKYKELDAWLAKYGKEPR